MKSMLITGGAGFIGSNFCHYWRNKYPGDKLVVLDKLTYAGKLSNLEGVNEGDNYSFIEGDICDEALLTSLFEKHAFNTVVHFAAESHVDRSISGPGAFIETNIVGTYTLLQVAKSFWLDQDFSGEHRFHHISTDEVYGSLGPTDPAFTETTAYAPNSPYSASKASSDHLVRAYHHTYGLNTTISNCSNNYGSRQDSEKLIPLIIHNILQGKSLPIYGDGKNIRDWLYVDDHCRAIDLILQKGEPGEVYNVGGENEWQNIDIVNLICDQLDKELVGRQLKAKYPDAPIFKGGQARDLITYVTDRAGHDRRYAIDPSKCHKKLSYSPAETFETGIAKTICWYIAE